MKTLILLCFFALLFTSCCLSSTEYQSAPPASKIVVVDSNNVFWADENTVYLPFLYFELVSESDSLGHYTELNNPSTGGTQKAVRAMANYLTREIETWKFYFKGSEDFGIWVELVPVPDAEMVYQGPPSPDTLYMPRGGSLSKTFGMSNAQALEFANKFKKKHWYDQNGKLVVIVNEGYYIKEWRPVNDFAGTKEELFAEHKGASKPL